MKTPSFYLLVLLLGLVLFAPSIPAVAPVQAAGLWYVVPAGGNDANNCTSPATACATLYGPLAKAGFAAGDTIRMAVGTVVRGADVRLDKNINLSGGWDSTFSAQIDMSTVDGSMSAPPIWVTGSAVVTIERLRFVLSPAAALRVDSGSATIVECEFEHNNVGIYNAGTLVVSNTTISGNTLYGGIYNAGNLTVVNSTISGNTTSMYYSGIYNAAGGVAQVYNTTVAGNNGSGVNNAGALTLRNSIVAGNGSDCQGTIGSAGYNLIGNTAGCTFSATTGDLLNVNANLGPLDYNGGPTRTHALRDGSPAVDAGNSAGCVDPFGSPLSTDQRGFPRSGRCDIGAVELQPIEYSTKTVDSSIAFGGDARNYTVSVRNPGPSPIANVRVTDTVPVTLAYVNGSLTATGGTAGYSGGVITWMGSVNPGSQVDIQFMATVNPSAPTGPVDNSAIIQGAGAIISRTARVNINTHFANAVKTVDKSIAQPGDSLNYQVGFQNSTGVTGNFRITDILPAQLNYTTGSLSATTGNPAYNNGVITWNGSLNGGAGVTVSFAAQVKPGTPSGNSVINSAAIAGGAEVITRTVATNIQAVLYLPYIMFCEGRIYGRVAYKGANAAGIPLLLRFWDGSAWSTMQTTSTAADGTYAFLQVPALAAGQKYYVRYANSGNPAYVSSWWTRELTSFAPCTRVAIGDFDIANMTLQSPADGVGTSLPCNFQWTSRSIPSDSFEFNLFNPASSNGLPTFSSPLLGNWPNYYLSSLPAGFATFTRYGWYAGVYSPDGGYGQSYYYRRISFLTTGLPAPGNAAPSGRTKAGTRLDDGRGMPHEQR